MIAPIIHNPCKNQKSACRGVPLYTVRMDRLTITKATAADIPFIAAILTDAVRYKLDHHDTAWGSKAFSDEEVRGMVMAGLTYIMHLDGEPVGTVRLQWEDKLYWGEQPPDAGYIHLLAVKAGMHGRELGGHIIEWAIAEVGKNNRRFLRLDCRPDNKKLREYYEKHGFRLKRKQRIDNDESDVHYTAALYERKTHD